MPRRRVLRWVVLGVVVYAAAVVAVLLVARARATDGQRILEQARDELTTKDLIEGRGEQQLRAAAGRFDIAQRMAGSVALLPLRALPIAGRQLAAFDSLAGAARDTATVARDALHDARSRVGDTLPTGPDRVRVLRDLQAIAKRAAARLRTVSLGPSQALAGPLDRAHRRFAGELTDLLEGLDRTTAAAGGLADALAGPSSYLLFAANNAEMRSGSGMFLSVGVLTMQDGRFSIGDVVSVNDVVVPPGVPISDADVAHLWGYADPSREWRNLGLSPRFDVTAEMATRMWAATGRPAVDGVIAVDVLALQALLRATGPVPIADGSVDATNVVPLLLHDQYAGLDPHDPQTERRERLAEVAHTVVGRLEGGGLRLSELADQLRLTARGRHVLAWARDRGVEDAWLAAGIAGVLAPDSMLVTPMNRGGNKLDHFVDVAADLAMRHDDRDGTTAVTVTVNITNHAPEADVPYVMGTGDTVARGDYPAILLVELPRNATTVSVDGQTPLLGGPDGATSQALAFDVVVPRGTTITRTLRFRLPPGFPSLRVESSARATGIAWTGPGTTWNDGDGPHTLTL